MSGAPWQRADGGVGPRHRAATGGHRHGMVRPRQQDDLEDIRRDARVRGGWLGHSGGYHSRGDTDGRVHGGYPPRRHFTAGDSSRLSRASRAREDADNLERELESIESSIVLPICLNTEDMHSTWRVERYLVAAKRLLRLDTCGDIDRRRGTLLKAVVSSLADEFCHLRVWTLDGDAMREHSPASIWESARRSRSCSSSAGSAASWLSSSSTGTSDASSYGGDACYDVTGLGEEPSVQGYDGTFAGKVYIDRGSSSILDDIARVMIRARYEHVLRQAFHRHAAQLARYIGILDIDGILDGHHEEPREILQKVWTSATHIIVAFLSEMRRQLNGQEFRFFNALKEDYFMAIAKVSVVKLLKSVTSICIQVGPSTELSCKDNYVAVNLSKSANVLMMHRALNHGMPRITALFLGKTKEFILAEGEGLIDRLSDIFLNLSVQLNNLVRLQCLFISNTGVHRATKHIMHHMQMLVQEKDTIHLMLKGGFNAFGEMIKGLIKSLELMLIVNSRSLKPQGQQQIFLLNNVHYMLEEAQKNTDLGLILGRSWFSHSHDQVDRWIAGYVDASWTPVVSSLERQTQFPTILWPHQLLYKFISSFEMTYNVQKGWKVTDPLIQQRLRESIYHKVVPLYGMHMENYSVKIHKSARYSIQQLESQLMELFEG